MNATEHIWRLVDVVAPWWAGEAEVARTYFNSPKRTVQTDMLWLSRQCFKEYWGSGVSQYDRRGVFLGQLKSLIEIAPQIDLTIDRKEIQDILEGLQAEFSHYVLFAEAYDAIRPEGVAKMNPQNLTSWPEEDQLTALRYQHQDEHGAVGMRACKFTEGGYCTLFTEGMALKGRGGVDDKIAEACAAVYDDEFGHMLAGVAGITDEGMSEADWLMMEKLAVEQMKKRIHMRNGEFGNPLSAERIAAIGRGEITPVHLDWARAGIPAPSHATA